MTLGTLFTLFTTLVSSIKIPYTKDTYNTPAYFFREGTSTHLRFLNYRMTISSCQCSYTKLQAPLQPLTPDPTFPRPLYLRLNLTTLLTNCINFKGCTGDVLSVASKAGAMIIGPGSNTSDIRFGGSSFVVDPSTFKIQETPIKVQERVQEKGRSSFIPSLRRINKHLSKVFNVLRVTIDQAKYYYWRGVLKFYKGHHWVPKSKAILRLDFNHGCVLMSRKRYSSNLLLQPGPRMSFKCLMQPLPFRGTNVTYAHKLSHVYKVGKVYFANLDNPTTHPTHPPYMGPRKPYDCPFMLSPVDVGVTTCRTKVLKYYLQWRPQKKFYMRYPTFVHFLRACQEYANEPYIGHKIKEGSFDGTLPTLEFQPDQDAIRLAAMREGHLPSPKEG